MTTENIESGEQKMNLQDYQGVFVFVQQVDHKITGVSYELLGKGKELAADLGTEVTAVLLGYQVEDLCPKLARYGADKIILVDNEALEPYTTEPYAHAMYNVIEKYKPAVVLYGATAIGRDLAPRVSARVHTGPDCRLHEVGNRSGYEESEDDSPGIRRQHHGDHPLPGASSADGNGSSRRYAED